MGWTAITERKALFAISVFITITGLVLIGAGAYQFLNRRVTVKDFVRDNDCRLASESFDAPFAHFICDGGVELFSPLRDPTESFSSAFVGDLPPPADFDPKRSRCYGQPLKYCPDGQMDVCDPATATQTCKYPEKDR